MGMALRGYYRSPAPRQPFIESHLDIRDAEGDVVPGYGWIFPMGDGRVNVGVGLLSTDRRWKGVNTTHLMDAFVAWAPSLVGALPGDLPRPADRGQAADGSGRRPAGRRQPRWWSGDAGRVDQPLQRRGHRLRLRNRAAGRGLAWARRCRARGPTPSSATSAARRRYGLYFRVARAFVRMISRPELMQAVRRQRACAREWLMEWMLRIMANLLRPDEIGPAEAAYRALALIARMAPAPDGSPA